MSPSLEAALGADFVDPTRVYFYCVRAVTLPASAADSTRVAQQIRVTIREIARDVVAWRRVGFISADAEP